MTTIKTNGFTSVMTVEGLNRIVLGVVVFVVKLYENRAFTRETQFHNITFNLITRNVHIMLLKSLQATQSHCHGKRHK